MRYVTSFNFLLVLGLFFLPWIDVRCDFGGQKLSVLTQSGFQTANGGHSKIGSNENDKSRGRNADIIGNKRITDEISFENANLMFVYLAAICAGVVLSLVLPRGKMWCTGVLLCIIIAAVSLGTQTAIGFPVEHKVQELQRQLGQAGNIRDGDAVAMALVNGNVPKFVASFLFPYYLSWLFVLSCAFCVFMESMLNSKTTKKRNNRTLDDDDPVTDDNQFR